MRIAKRLLIVCCVWAFVSSLCAQSLVITKNFAAVPYSVVSAQYKNEFGKWEKPLLDDTFPYALIRVGLEGNEREVTAAKQKLGLYLGRLHMPLEKLTDKPNELLFLIPAGAGHVEIQCGDGCTNQTIIDLPRLQSNMVYYGKVHYTPMEDPVLVTTTQAPKRQFFKFRVTPANAVVTIVENGAQEILPMREGGIASKMLNYGTYSYSIAADKYHTKEGSFTVSATQTEMAVDLLPQFGWLTITGDNISQGGYVFATNTATGGMIQLGTIPLNNREMSSGIYTLRVQKEKYKDYSTTITIEDGKTTTIRPSLEANFAQVTLTTNEGADIYVDGNRLGTTRWTGTLELGEHSVETRQASHHSAYTNVRITPQSAGQTITLNNPLPIYGSLIVDGSPVDVDVYVDGKKVGTSPFFVSELLIGTHKIRLEKDGYDQQEKTVQIAENQESMLDFTLTKTIAKAPVVPAAPQGGAIETITVKGVSFNMIKVQGSTFTMGATAEQGSDADSDEKPMHQVTLSDYYIGETEVTQELWQAVMGTTIQYQAKKGAYGSTSLYGVGNSYPMYYISWDDCQTFVTKLNQLTGKNFRLPTEAEWEYAARGGQKSRGYKYAGSNILSDVAWYSDNSGSQIHPVKQKQANELGLYDMSGNVWEWCQDWYDSYRSNAQTNPTGPSSGVYRVYRGGGWNYSASGCRVAVRYGDTPGGRNCFLGFRVVLLP